MDSQEVAKISHKAKRETEAFINHYMNDQAKGWPLIRDCGSAHTGYRQQKHVLKPRIVQ